MSEFLVPICIAFVISLLVSLILLGLLLLFASNSSTYPENNGSFTLNLCIFFYVGIVFLFFLFDPEAHAMEPGGLGDIVTTTRGEGRPILEGRPIYWEIRGTPAQAFYFPTLLELPSSISDHEIIAKLGRINGSILFHEDLQGQMNPAYSLEIQRELDQTPVGSLSAKLDYFIHREEMRFYQLALEMILKKRESQIWCQCEVPTTNPERPSF